MCKHVFALPFELGTNTKIAKEGNPSKLLAISTAIKRNTLISTDCITSTIESSEITKWTVLNTREDFLLRRLFGICLSF